MTRASPPPPDPPEPRCLACSGWSWWRSGVGAWRCLQCSPGPATWQSDLTVSVFNSHVLTGEHGKLLSAAPAYLLERAARMEGRKS
jgi:hypothetical protein